MKGWVGLVGQPIADGLPTSGPLSATGRAQDRESSPTKDRRSSTMQRKLTFTTQASSDAKIKNTVISQIALLRTAPLSTCKGAFSRSYDDDD